MKAGSESRDSRKRREREVSDKNDKNRHRRGFEEWRKKLKIKDQKSKRCTPKTLKHREGQIVSRRRVELLDSRVAAVR